ncbi:MAG: hypothetical protein V1866_07125 [archaeon]
MDRVRKGQTASSAGVVIIIITILIILYILFLPPQDRAALLGDETGTGTGTGTAGGKSGVLFSKTPGRIFPSGGNMIEHTMPSFLVFTVTNANELKRVDSLYVKNSAFSDKTGEIPFFYDTKTMADLKLSFNVRSHDGKLKIMLNNYEVYYGELDDGSPQPISLPKEYMTQRNKLLFEVSEPGAAFWRVNEYELENVLVSGKVTDYSAAKAEQHFSISDSEFEKLEKSVLEFLPDCPPREEGLVQILINGRAVFTSYPDCGIRTSIEISKEFLKAGDNILAASTEKGSFLLDAPKLTTFLKDTAQPVFYFSMPQALLDAIYAGQRGLMATVRFADSSKVKRGYIEINGFKLYFEAQDVIYQAPVDPASLMPGSNSLKIVPQSDAMDVAEIRIDVI